MAAAVVHQSSPVQSSNSGALRLLSHELLMEIFKLATSDRDRHNCNALAKPGTLARVSRLWRQSWNTKLWCSPGSWLQLELQHSLCALPTTEVEGDQTLQHWLRLLRRVCPLTNYGYSWSGYGSSLPPSDLEWSDQDCSDQGKKEVELVTCSFGLGSTNVFVVGHNAVNLEDFDQEISITLYVVFPQETRGQLTEVMSYSCNAAGEAGPTARNPEAIIKLRSSLEVPS